MYGKASYSKHIAIFLLWGFWLKEAVNAVGIFLNLLNKINFFALFFSVSIYADVIQYSGVSYISSNENIKDIFPNTLKR